MLVQYRKDDILYMYDVTAFIFVFPICSREKRNVGKKVLDNIQLMKTSKNNVSSHSINVL